MEYMEPILLLSGAVFSVSIALGIYFKVIRPAVKAYEQTLEEEGK